MEQEEVMDNKNAKLMTERRTEKGRGESKIGEREGGKSRAQQDVTEDMMETTDDSEGTGDMKMTKDNEKTSDKKTRRDKGMKGKEKDVRKGIKVGTGEQVDQTVSTGTEVVKENAECKVEDTDGQAEDEDQSEIQQKSVRRRKKRLLAQITQQMEFYFSAANISKDTFMAELLTQDSYIPIKIFFKFNRIRSLTTDIGLLRTAISKSSALELSDDGERVCSANEIVLKEDETACTIYVENIPSQADHDWVRKAFAQYGTIDYISLPRYSRSGRPKGFAFVEFATPAMADSALEAFGALNCMIPTTSDPANLQSIKGFNEEEGEGDIGAGRGGGERGGVFEGSRKDKVEKGDYNGGKTREEKITGGRNMETETAAEGTEKIRKKRKRSSEKLKEDEIDSESTNESEKVKQKEIEGANIKDKSTGDLSEADGSTSSQGHSNAKTGKKRLLDLDEDRNQEPEQRKKKHEGRSDDKEESPKQNAQKEQEGIQLEYSDPSEKKRKRGESRSKENDNRNPDQNAEQQQQENEQMETYDPVEKKKKGESWSKENSPGKFPDKIAPKQKQQQQHQDELMETSEPKTKSSAGDSKKKKKKRKRNKKEKEEQVDSIHLRVISKADWKRLRNKYLNAQSEYMRSLKRELRQRKSYYNSRWAADDMDWNSGPPDFLWADKGARDSGRADVLNSKDESARERGRANFLKSENGNSGGGTGDNKAEIQFVEGAILKISFEEPPQDPKKMNETIRQGSDGGVAYVDVKPTERDVYVRFHSKEAAEEYRRAGCWSRMELLTGAEEEKYWKYINSCREQQRSKKNRKIVVQGYGQTELGKGEARGRDKLLGKAVRQTHNPRPSTLIIFED